jgi:isopentenyl diphosphate isomerase/L-lactate dehydrogenase-like FMN-dependent dehydrogenase
VNQNIKRTLPSPSALSELLKFKKFEFNARKRRLAAAHTIWDLRDIAKARTPQGPFDYTDGGAELEISLNRSREVFSNIEFAPKILQDVSTISTQAKVLGNTFALPFGMAPTGFTRMMHAEGELAVAKAAAKFGIPYSLSTVGTTSIEDVVSAAPNGVNWFQLYMWKDRDASMQLVERAKKAGVTNLILTVDVPVAGARLRDVRNGLTVPPTLSLSTIIDAVPRREWWWNFLTTKPLEFASMSNWNGTVAELLDYMFDPTMTFEDLKWLRKNWDGTLTVKGIQTLDDARKAAKYGADAVILSNHGGRQLDRAPVPLMLVEQVSKELKKDVEVHLDSGIMSGADIVAAIALGANFTYIGKAYLYGLMAGGQEGVERCLSIIESQIIRTMKLLGVKDLKELTPKQVKILDRLQ